MAGYEDTKQKIISALMGRPNGTEIQPENHQNFALSLLEYIRSVELISESIFIGIATSTTVPVQSDVSFECYLSSCGKGQSITFENFHGYDGNALTYKSEDNSAHLILLIWNKQYWEIISIETSVSALEIAQTTGQSKTVTMSQKAITDNLNKKPTIADAEADLDIGDEDGNVIARFKDGHVKTKNFDSQNALNEIAATKKNQDQLKESLTYHVCDTDGSTLVKRVNVLANEYSQGISQKVKMVHAHTAVSGVVKYKFGSEEREMFYNGIEVTSTNTWANNEIIEVWFDDVKAYAKPWQNNLIDSTLKIEHAAADAKATGERIVALEKHDVSDKLIWGTGIDPELIIKDSDGKQIVEFNDDQIKTLGFDSRKCTQNEDDAEADLDIGDEDGNVIARFKDGHVKTKNFDSSTTPYQTDDNGEADLQISDPNGNVIVEFKDGHVKTKNFDSQNSYLIDEKKKRITFGVFAARVITTKNNRKVAIISNGFVENSTLYV